jgi:hypothetical protein
MTRNRARPSFTVEIKRTRNSPLVAAPGESPRLPSETPKPAARNLWAGTGLIEEATAATQSGRFDDPAPALPPARAPAAASAAPSRRVLQSLILPPEPPPPPEPEPGEEEEPMYRIRRRRPAAPRPASTGFVWPEDWPDEPPVAAAPAPVPAPPAPAPVALAAVRTEAEAPRPKRREDDLRVGERWKRRLPRYCR